MQFTFSAFYTLIAAVIVLLLGRVMVNNISFLRKYSIPEPVAGGLVAAALSSIAYSLFDLNIDYHADLRTSFMLIFFASVGLSANFSRLKEGGVGLIVFLAVVGVFIVIQNLVGVGLATALGIDPLIGLIVGSITLTGGHGTAGAWGETLEQVHGVTGAIPLGMAAATFGLVLGGLIGGPLANYLIKRHQLAAEKTDVQLEQIREKEAHTPVDEHNPEYTAFENRGQVRLITADNAITTLGMFAICLAVGEFMTGVAKNTVLELPTFVWVLATGVVLRTVLESVCKVDMFDRAIDVFGNAALSLYLAMALLAIKLWQLVDLAAPLVIILAVQTIVMMLYAAFVTFRIMGKDYDAAILAAGHCGFGMGATPTAVANMQAVTNRYKPSYKAFLIVPLCGAFLVDLINVVVIKGFISFL